MAISSNLAVTSDVEGYTLSELLDLLGSPKATKDALADLEKSAKKNAKALRDLKASNEEFQAERLGSDKKRQKEIDAIHRDNEALVAAWAKLEADTERGNANLQSARKKLRDDQAVFDKQKSAQEDQAAHIEASRDQISKQQDTVDGQVAEARREASADRKAAEKAKADAKQLNADANRKMADMRSLVG